MSESVPASATELDKKKMSIWNDPELSDWEKVYAINELDDKKLPAKKQDKTKEVAVIPGKELELRPKGFFEIVESAIGETAANELAHSPAIIARIEGDAKLRQLFVDASDKKINGQDTGARIEEDEAFRNDLLVFLGRLDPGSKQSSRSTGPRSKAVAVIKPGSYNPETGQFETRDNDEYGEGYLTENQTQRRKGVIRQFLGKTNAYLNIGIIKVHDFMGRGNSKWQERFDNASPEEQKKMLFRSKVRAMVGFSALSAIYMATRIHQWESLATGGGQGHGLSIDTPHAGGSSPDSHGGIPGLTANMTPDQLADFFNKAPDPAAAADKLGIHDFNHPLPAISDNNPQQFQQFNEALGQQLRGNAHELADYAGKMHINGYPQPQNYANMDDYYRAVDAKGDYLQSHPADRLALLQQVQDKVQHQLSGYKVVSIDQPYTSPYINGNELYEDNYVNDGGTVVRYTFTDGTVIDVRRECGQIIQMVTPSGAVTVSQESMQPAPAPVPTYEQPPAQPPLPPEQPPEQPPLPPEQPPYQPPYYYHHHPYHPPIGDVPKGTEDFAPQDVPRQGTLKPVQQVAPNVQTPSANGGTIHDNINVHPGGESGAQRAGSVPAPERTGPTVRSGTTGTPHTGKVGSR